MYKGTLVLSAAELQHLPDQAKVAVITPPKYVLRKILQFLPKYFIVEQAYQHREERRPMWQFSLGSSQRNLISQVTSRT